MEAVCRLEEELCTFIIYLNERVSAYLEPPRTWASGFSAKDSTLVDALAQIASGSAPGDAYREVLKPKLSGLGAEPLLEQIFSELGSGDIEIERRRLAEAEGELTRAVRADLEENRRRQRDGAIMAVMLSVGGIIAII